MFGMYASNSHSYTHLILALCIVIEPALWVFITSEYPGIHDIGLPKLADLKLASVLCVDGGRGGEEEENHSNVILSSVLRFSSHFRRHSSRVRIQFLVVAPAGAFAHLIAATGTCKRSKVSL